MLETAEDKLIRHLKFDSLRNIRTLVSCNPEVNLHYPMKNLKTPLTTAIDRGDLQILSLLLDKIPTNLDFTLTQACGKTALMHAAFATRNADILKLLIKKGADPEKIDIRGWNSLHYAVAGERLQNVLVFLNFGVSIDSPDFDGRTPIMISVYLSHFDVFSELLNRGASINLRDKMGLTVLLLAILNRNRECVVALLNKGKDDVLVNFATEIPARDLVKKVMFDVLPIKSYSDIFSAP